MQESGYYRTDDGEVIEVTPEVAFEAGTFLELPDGSFAIRCKRPSSRLSVKQEKLSQKTILQKPAPSDALGFGVGQLEEMRQHAERENVVGVEFLPDPQVPQFYQVHCASEKAKKEYMKSRGFTDRNSTNGGARPFTPEQFEAAKAIILRQHGE